MASSRVVKIGMIVAVAIIGVGLYMFIHRNEESTDDANIDAHVVTISPKVGGYVKALHIDDNMHVKAGDVLLEIDPRDYEIRVDHARAALAAAQAGHSASAHTLDTTSTTAPSNLDAAKAEVDAAQAAWVKAAHDLKRLRSLSDEARSREQLDADIAAEKSARASLEDAKAKLRSAQTAPKVIAQAKATAEEQAAQIKQAESDLAQAEKDLADTKVIAPINGRITERSVEMGDYIQPGQQLTALVGDDFWVVANFKETQIDHMKPGDRAVIHVDAYPEARLEGKVDSIQSGTGARFSAFPPENATGNFVKIVQRVPVKILFDKTPDASLVLGPGMSVVPTVYTK